MSQFDDIGKRAGATARISLSPVVGQMQDVRRAYSNLAAPPCAQKYQSILVSVMDDEIQGYLDFMAQKPDAQVSSSFVSAKVGIANAEAELETVHALMGTPTPTK